MKGVEEVFERLGLLGSGCFSYSEQVNAEMW